MRRRCFKGREQSQKARIHAREDRFSFCLREHGQGIPERPQPRGIRVHAAALHTFIVSREVGFPLIRNASEVRHFMYTGEGQQRRGRAAIHDDLSRPRRKHPRDARRSHPFGVSRRLYRQGFTGRRKAQGRGVQLFDQLNAQTFKLFRLGFGIMLRGMGPVTRIP